MKTLPYTRPWHRLSSGVVGSALMLAGALSLLAGLVVPVWAQDNPVIAIDPASAEIDVDDTATVEVRIEGVVDLVYVDMLVTFDPDLLEVVDADPDTSGVQIEPGTLFDTVESNAVLADDGEIYFVVSGDPVSGDGVLATITFRGKAGGTSDVTIDEGYLYLENADIEAIDVDIQDGSIVVTGGAPPTTTPSISDTPAAGTPTTTPTPGPILVSSPFPSPSPRPRATASPYDLRVLQVWPDRSVGMASGRLEGSASVYDASTSDADVLPFGLASASGRTVRAHTYLDFPLQVFPPGTQVLRATLYVYVDSASSAGKSRFGVYRVLEPWEETGWGSDPKTWPTLLSSPIAVAEVRFQKIVPVQSAVPGITVVAFRPAGHARPAFQSDPVLSFVPSTVELDVGNTATVTVRIQDVTNLYAADLYIDFDPAVVEVVDADPDTNGVQVQMGDFLNPDTAEENLVYEADGEIELIQVAVGEPVSGTGALAVIAFRGKAAGTSSLTFDLDGTYLEDGEEEPIAFDDQSGSIVVLGEEAPTPTPTPSDSPLASPTSPSSPLPTPTVSPTPTPGPTSTPTPTSVPGATASPTATPTPAPTVETGTATMALGQAEGTWVTWDVTALTRAWLSGEVPDYGLALAAAPGCCPGDLSNLLVARMLTTDDPDTVPYLVVSFEVHPVTPTPTATPIPLLPPAGGSAGWGGLPLLLAGVVLLVLGLVVWRKLA